MIPFTNSPSSHPEVHPPVLVDGIDTIKAEAKMLANPVLAPKASPPREHKDKLTRAILKSRNTLRAIPPDVHRFLIWVGRV